MIKQRGVALVIVLWMLVLLTIMTFSYSKMTRSETKLSASSIQQAKAKAIAEAGLWTAVNELLKQKTERTWPVDGTKQRIQFEDKTISVAIQDQNGKIDLNTGSQELLKQLVMNANLDVVDPLPIFHAILDWRDRNDLSQLHGAESKDYKAAGLDYTVKNGPFNHVSELQKVMGVTPEIYSALKPAITVHSHQPRINLKTAPKEVLLMLPNFDEGNIELFLETRQQEKGRDLADLHGIDKKSVTNAQGPIYSIFSTSKHQNNVANLHAVIFITPNKKTPYTMLSWSWSES